MAADMDEVAVNGVQVVPFDFIAVLTEAKWLQHNGDTFIAGVKLDKLIREHKTMYAPYPASEGVTERRRGYAGRAVTSPLFREAIQALEATEYTVSDQMLAIAREVYGWAKGDDKEQLKKEMYVLQGSSKLDSSKSYVSEFFGDSRLRMYQACAFGPNGQSSDMARALMDLAGVSTQYDVAAVTKILIAEMYDMGSFKEGEFEHNIAQVLEDAPKFILSHVAKTNHIKKPWNFTKFALILTELRKGNRPYIGVAVGLDAKCSCAQIGGLLVADEALLAATGFSLVEVEDAYNRASTELGKLGIHLTRALIKKPFMATLYGSSALSMMNPETITEDTFNALYTGLSQEEMEVVANKLHKGIVNSFGLKLNNLRGKMRNHGYDFDTKTDLYDKPVSYETPDGCVIAMDLRKDVNIDGNYLSNEIKATDVKVDNDLNSAFYKKLTFKTSEYAYSEYARTGFVNMVQGVDALLARLIIVNLKRAGAQHIISVHDCFRVNVTELPLLEDAIKQAYLSLFGTETNEYTQDMPNGLDILALYFKGANQSLVAGAEQVKASQFYGKDEYRRLDEVNGEEIPDLINALGQTYYFAK